MIPLANVASRPREPRFKVAVFFDTIEHQRLAWQQPDDGESEASGDE